MSGQLSFLPPLPAPPPKPKPSRRAPDPENPRVMLWREGLAILRNLVDQPDGALRKLMGRLADAAGGDAGALLTVLREARDIRPADPVPWLIAACRVRRGEDDPWGLRAWMARAPDALSPEAAQAVREAGYDALAEIMEATTIAPSCRPGYEPLIGWLLDERDPASIAAVIGKLAGTSDRITSLRYFDAMVRRSATKWDPVRMEYR